MILLVLCELAVEAVESPGDPPQTPVAELDHPRYLDAAGEPVTWKEVRAMSVSSGAPALVRRRRAGRTVLRVVFAAATVAEVWGTTRLVRDENWLAIPLGVQASLTGLCGVLLWTGAPEYRMEDRALVLNGANTQR